MAARHGEKLMKDVATDTRPRLAEKSEAESLISSGPEMLGGRM
jgi:hypothetical protein